MGEQAGSERRTGGEAKAAGLRMCICMDNNELNQSPDTLAPLHHVPSVAELLTPDDVAAALGVSTKTLANYRARGTGPRHIRVGGKVYYRREDYAAYWNALMGGAA